MKQSHPPCFRGQEVQGPPFAARMNNLTPVCETITHIVKRKETRSFKEGKELQSWEQRLKKKIRFQKQLTVILWHQAERSRVLRPIVPTFAKPNKRQPQKAGLGQQRERMDLQTPHAQPGPSQSLLRADWRSHTDQHRCHHQLLQCHQSTLRNEESDGQGDDAEPAQLPLVQP